jgi:phenylalanyl-tRNA synthetase alpha chain
LSAQPATRRDLSIACAAGTDHEALGDRIRDALGPHEVAWIEDVRVLSRTPARGLPAAARARMGMSDDQENLLVSVVLHHPTRSLPKAEANRLRDRIYAAIHVGEAHEWAA